MAGPDSLMITPETKVGQMLDAMPELEPVLMALSPKFEKLKNPVLRRTVARVATLKQVARVGNIPVADLIRELRTAAGLPEWSGNTEDSGHEDTFAGEPDLFTDIRPDIEAGKHPMEVVMGQLRTLSPGGILELTAPFEPAPLLDSIRQQGYRYRITQRRPDFVVIWIQKPGD